MNVKPKIPKPNEAQQLDPQQLPSDADVAALTAAARELSPSDIVGLPLKFVKGKWFMREGKELERTVGDTDTFVVDPRSYTDGWIRWENKKPTHKVYARRVDGWIPPMRDALPDRNENLWPIEAKEPQDPWQEIQMLLLKEVAADQMLTWQTSSYGGRGAISEFLKDWAAGHKAYPGQSPVVLLQSWDKPNPDWGKIPTPRLKIVGWQAFGEGATPAGDPARSALARQALLALPKPEPVKALSRHRDMDDQIPFS